MNLLANYAIDVLTDAGDGYGLFGGKMSVVTFVSLCFIALLVCVNALVFFIDKKKVNKSIKYTFWAALCYSLAVGILLLCLKIQKDADKRRLVWLVFVPILVTLFVILASGVCLSFLKGEKGKKAAPYLAGACALSVLITLALIAVYYYTKISGGKEYYTEEWAKFNSAALYIFAAALVFVVLAAGFLLDKKPLTFDAGSLAFAGVCVALSFALSYVKIYRLPQGGSITLVSMLPIMLFSYTYGLRKGLIVGLAYGVLQSVQDPYIIHPAQFLLDYPIAYTMVGFAGVFSDFKPLSDKPRLRFAFGAGIGGILRYISHVLSGVFAFGSWADLEKYSNLWAYSAAYNSVVLIDVALVIVAGVIVLSSKSVRTALDKRSGEKQ